MAWESVKRIFRGHGKSIDWIEAPESFWGVRVLDVRPVTLTMHLWSGNEQHASNAVSFKGDDGTGFIGEEPPVARMVEANLLFPIDRLLAEGVLFTPEDMDNKWALFYHQGEIICVDSWRRQFCAAARVQEHDNHVEITGVRGAFVTDGEAPEFTVRVLDYLLRSHAFEAEYPAPLPEGMEQDPRGAAPPSHQAARTPAYVRSGALMPINSIVRRNTIWADSTSLSRADVISPSSGLEERTLI